MASLASELERHHELVVILDFGSQYTHLIARRLREVNVYCELVAYDTTAEVLAALNPQGIVLSGGPSSVYEPGAPHMDAAILDLGIPILGICYGLQELAHHLPGGSVVSGDKKEFGHATLTLAPPGAAEADPSALFEGFPAAFTAWMSHGDKLASLPTGFAVLASTDNTEHAAVGDAGRRFYGLQFHPEVTHSDHGTALLRNWTRNVCGCSGDWTMADFVKEAVTHIRTRVGDGVVIGAVSGGVDSTVAAVLLQKAIGDQFRAFLVDNGLLRKGEAKEVVARLHDKCGVALTVIDGTSTFLSRLDGVVEPEKKRKIIGNTFIDLFDAEASKVDAAFLLQGTLYPDVIESISHKGPSATIKTHHNVGGLPATMKLQLIEPLRFLFKDEVRALGLVLGVEAASVGRHPFPGPGLAIRILGEVTPQRLSVLRDADAIYIEELRAADLYDSIGQAFAVLLPVKAVGVMGDCRTYEEVIALRAVETSDFMTANWYDLPTPLLRRVSTRIVNEVRGINRVTYDITSKPPGTIEWL